MTVYVFGHRPVTGPVKIGYTGRPITQIEERLAEIKGKTAGLIPDSVDRSTLEVLSAFIGIQSLEQWLHGHFAKARVVGEWFNLGPNPDMAIEHVRAAILRYETTGMAGRYAAPPTPKAQPTTNVARVQAAAPAVTDALVAASASPPNAATIHFALFSAWVEAGFTRDEALHLLTSHPSFDEPPAHEPPVHGAPMPTLRSRRATPSRWVTGTAAYRPQNGYPK